MSQNWPSISGADDVSRSKLIDRFDALRSQFAGTSRPSAPVAGQLFFDTDSGPIMEVCTNATGPVWAALASVLGDNTLDPDKLAFSATQRLAGRNSGGAGAGEEVTISQALDWLGGTRGMIMYRGASGWAALGPGAAGQMLQSGGAGADPTWGTASASITLTGDVTGSGAGSFATTLVAASVLSKLLTVDGAGSLLDSDLLDGQQGTYYLALGNATGTLASALFADNTIVATRLAASATNKLFGRYSASAGAGEEIGLGTGLSFSGGNLTINVATALGYTPLNAASYTAADVLSKLLTVDGASSLLDADLLDGQEGSYYRSASNLNAGTVPAAQMPALTGEVTTSAGAVATTLGATAITNRTADATPDMSADYALTYDTSATALKKVLLQYIGAGKQAFWVPASGIAPRVSNGCAALATLETATNKLNWDHLAFDAATQEFAVFDWRAPKAIDTNTFTFIFVWSHPSTTTNFGVVWGISGAGRGDGDALEIALGTAVTIADTGGSTDTLYTTAATGAMTVGGSFAAEDVIKFQVSRNPSDGSDTLAVDARLHGIWVIVTTNRNTEQ